MGAHTDFFKNEFVQDLIRDNYVKILRTQLVTKFGKLPKWADEQLAQARPVQLESWLKKFASANTLEASLGKK